MRAIPHSLTSILCLSASVLGLSTAAATTDFYSSGPGLGTTDTMCDVWQALYNGWGLNPDADEDFDGATNYTESVAGTDPRNANDVIRVGNTTIAGNTISFTFDAEKGKRYRVLSDTSSPTGAYATVKTISAPVTNIYEGGQAFIPSANNPTQTISVTRSGTREYYRLETTDADRDGDGVSDWAEGQLGSDAGVSNSGAGYTYADTVRSMMTLTVSTASTDAAGFEVVDKSVPPASTVVKKAKIALMRSWPPAGDPVPAMPINGITLTGANAASAASKSNATPVIDYTTLTIDIPAGQGVTGSPYQADAVTPIKDAIDEVPEYAAISAHLPIQGSPVVPGTATVCVCDADPTNAENNQLYVAFLGHEAGVNTTASGYATAIVNGDNTSASVSVVFNNLSSEQNTAYIRSGPNNDLAPALPTGQVSGFNYNVEYKPGHYSTDQLFLSALANGQIACAITTANNPEKEIWGYFSKSTGTQTFNPANPNLVAPAAGDSTFLTATNEQIERDIWRFMGQSTWGGTTAMYNAIRAKVDTRISALGGSPTAQQITAAYVQGLGDWLDEQMNPATTPTINFRTLVMAGDNEEMALRGNRPVTYNNDPQINGARYTVTFDNAGNPVVGTAADTNFINNNYPISGPNRRREWWGMILQSKDQVRQRFTQALSEIVIISEADQTCADRHYGTANYWDMIAENAFGKYRNLLEKVTYSPMMGVYLSSMSNRKAYDAGGGVFVSPDENYAREIMQLFSIGLVLRHPDGSLVLDAAGLPIATYDNNDITELARVMTGFSHGARHAIGYYGGWSGTSLTTNNATSDRISDLVVLNGSSALNNTWFGRQDGHLFWAAPWIYPMKVIGRIGSTEYHDFGAKTLLSGKHGQTIIPAQTITTMSDAQTHTAADTDLRLAHNMLAGDPASDTAYNGHQNTAVNMSRWLIQRLITSNPSAGYIYRVSETYRTTNGNLGAVLKSILLDYEARSLQLSDSSISHGKVKEPLVAFASMLRTLRAFSGLPVSTLKDNPPSFSGTDSPMPNGYPLSEFNKFSSDNTSPPSLPAGWAPGPFRFRFNDLTGVIGQSPQKPPSVFNWFLPDYVVPGPMAEAGLFAPELQINTESGVVAKVNQFYANTWSNLTGMTTQPGSDANISDMLLNNNMATPAVRFSLDGGATFVSSLTFTPADGTTAKNLTVVGANTTWLTNVDNSTLRFSVAGTGSGFDAIPVQPIDISFTDNDLPNEQILANHTSFNTWVQEGGKTDTITVRLSAPPPGSVTVNAATTTGQVTISPSSLTFDGSNWNTNQSITVTAVVDNTAEAPGTAGDTIAFTGTGYGSISLPVGVTDGGTGANVGYDVLVTELDTFGPAGGTFVTESTATTYTLANAGIVDAFSIVLTKQPSASVVVTCTQASLGNQLTMNTTNGGTTFQTGAVTRTFTTANWNIAQEVRVTGNNDTSREMSYPANPMSSGQINISIATAAGGYSAGIPIQPVGVAVEDNDNRIIMAHTGGETRVSEDGLSDTINVRLRANPAVKVTINLGSNQVKCTPTNLVFVPTGVTPGPGETLWSTDQAVTVTAVDDHLNEGLQRAWAAPMNIPVIGTGTSTISSGAVTGVTITNGGSHYIGSVPSVTFSGGGGTGASATAIINAAGQISGVNVINGGSGYTTLPTVTFGNPFNAFATITASGTSEGVLDANFNNEWGNTYNGTFTQLFVTVIDNDNKGVIITPTGGSTTVVEGGSTDSFDVALAAKPSDTVTITLTPGTQVTTSTTTLTFTTSNWNTPQTVTVTGVNDATVEGDAFTSIGLVVVSSDVGYNGVKAKPVGVTVIDNDLVPLSIGHSNVFTGVSEGGSSGNGGTPNVSDTFTLQLPKTPTANVTVTLSFDASQITVSPTTMTFTPTSNQAVSGTTSGFNVNQTITVTAVDDAAVETTPHNTMIRFAVSSTDPFYNNPAHLPVFVPIKDNDAPGYSIVESTGNTTPGEGGNDTYTVVLTKPPASGQNVVINITSADVNDLLVNSSAAFTGGGTTNTSATMTMTSTVGLLPGMYITGTNIPAGTTVVSVTNGTTFVASKTATGTGSNITITAASVPAASAVLSFTNANWNTAQTIVTTPVPDMLTEGREVLQISHAIDKALTTDNTFDEVGNQSVTCFIGDQHRRNESIIIIPSGGSIGSNETVISGGNSYVTEGDTATDSVDIYLSNAPQIPVIVSLTANAQMGFDKSTLVFDASNWNVPQTVQVNAIDDTFNDTYAIINGVLTQVAQSQNLSATATAGDAAFLGAATSSAINILDNESPAVKIVQTAGITTTTEGGAGSNIDTYTAVLTTLPNANVVVRVSSASTTAGQTVSPSVLTFTPANWNTPQTVTVTAVNDTTVEGNHRSNITHAIRTAVALPLSNCATSSTTNPTTVSTTSVVGLFTGMVVAGPGIPLNATISSINATANTFVISAAATATATGVSLTAYGTSPDSTGAVVLLTNGGTTNGGTTITCANTASLVPGTLLYGAGIPAGTTVSSITNGTSFVASAAATADGTGLTLAAINATTDTSGYARPLTSLATTSGSTTVTCASTVGLAAGMSIFGPGIPAAATIASISTGNTTTLTLSAAAGATIAGGTATVCITGIQTVVNNITDDDNRIIIGVTGSDTRVHEDGTINDTYSVVLRTLPTGSVTITPAAFFNNGASSFAQTTFSAQGLSISPASITFNTSNWSTPQTFTLTGADNSVNAERARTVTIVHTSSSTDANFNNSSVNNSNIHQVAINMLAKDDRRILLIDNPSGNENGNTSTYRVALNRLPTADVTIGLTADAQVVVAPPVPAGGVLNYASTANLTFTSANWNTFQTVTLRPVDDTVWEPTYNTGSGFLHTGGVTQVSTSSDTAYAGIPAGFSLMTITDNEVPAVRITPSGSGTTIYEGGASDTYDVVLTSAPTADVTFSVTADSQSTVSASSLTFTSVNWNVPQTVTISAAVDTAAEGNHTSVITHGVAASADGAYSGLLVPTLTANVIDNDGPQLVVTQSDGTTVVGEGGANDTISIALSQAATANVTVTLVPPMYIIPVPAYAKRWGYYTTDLGGSNQNKERVVVDYTELIELYRTTFYSSLATAYGGSGNIPLQPSDLYLQNAHWAATKAIVDKTDLWWCGGSLKARFPDATHIIQPNQAPPSPPPLVTAGLNPRQVLLDCIYQHNGGANSPSTTRYLPEVVFDPKNPPTGTFHDEIRDRCRWIGYLNSTVMPGFVQH